MTASSTFRKAVPNDAKVLSALALRSKAHWEYSREFLRMCESELTVQAHQIENSNLDYVVAEVRSTVVGFYALEKTSKGKFELEGLFVEPEHIGTGLGRRLIKHALDAVKGRGGRSLLVQGDPNAENFYLAAGGKCIGTRESASIPGRLLPLFEIEVRSHEIEAT